MTVRRLYESVEKVKWPRSKQWELAHSTAAASYYVLPNYELALSLYYSDIEKTLDVQLVLDEHYEICSAVLSEVLIEEIPEFMQSILDGSQMNSAIALFDRVPQKATRADIFMAALNGTELYGTLMENIESGVETAIGRAASLIGATVEFEE